MISALMEHFRNLSMSDVNWLRAMMKNPSSSFQMHLILSFDQSEICYFPNMHVSCTKHQLSYMISISTSNANISNCPMFNRYCVDHNNLLRVCCSM